MKEVLIKDYTDDIFIDDLDYIIPIFAVRDGKINGMFIHENNG